MNMQEPRRIGLHNIYEQFSYLWDADTDQMKWPKSARLILEDVSLFNCGDRYIAHLSEDDFDDRIKAIMTQTKSDQNKNYRCEYNISLPSRKVMRIREEGKLLLDEHQMPCGIYGNLTVIKEPLPSTINDNSQNPEGSHISPSSELDMELAANIKKDSRSSYMQVTIERLQHYALIHGLGAVKRVLRQIENVLEQSLRENDKRFKISGNSFGLILEDCGQAELLVIAHRIITKIDDANIRPHRDSDQISVSIGSALITKGQYMTPSSIRSHAQKALLDAQDIRSLTKPVTSLENNMRTTKERRKSDSTPSGGQKRA